VRPWHPLPRHWHKAELEWATVAMAVLMRLSGWNCGGVRAR
jgi:hypothetical protein